MNRTLLGPSASSPGHTARFFQLLLVTLAACSATSCTKEPCAHGEMLHPPPETSPFANQTPVFSVCQPCPVLRPEDHIFNGMKDVTGPATVCQVGFTDESRPEAFVACFYDEGGRLSTSLANDAVHGVPNHFEFCEANCHGDDLHGCTLTADSTGLTSVNCQYGRTCG